MTEKTAGKRARATNLDLLRILAMFLIVFLHSVSGSGLPDASEGGSIAFYYIQITYQMSKVCVNLFVLLSGYFLVTSEFGLRKLIALWLETVFYTLVIRLVFFITGGKTFSIASLASCFLPVFTGRYWFITIYFGLYALSPFLNRAIRCMNMRQLTACNCLLFVLFSVWISIHPSFAGMNSGRGWGLPWFVILYFAGAWFRLYYVPNKKWKLKLLAWPFISLIVVLTLCVGQRYSSAVVSIAKNWGTYDSVPVCIATLCLFAAFLNMEIQGKTASRWIAKVSVSTFGIYLIHAHADIAHWLWRTMAFRRYAGSAMLPLIHIGGVLLVFIACSAIDILRGRTIGRIERRPEIDRVAGWMESKAEWIVDRVLRSIGE